ILGVPQGWHDPELPVPNEEVAQVRPGVGAEWLNLDDFSLGRDGFLQAPQLDDLPPGPMARKAMSPIGSRWSTPGVVSPTAHSNGWSAPMRGMISSFAGSRTTCSSGKIRGDPRFDAFLRKMNLPVE